MDKIICEIFILIWYGIKLKNIPKFSCFRIKHSKTSNIFLQSLKTHRKQKTSYNCKFFYLQIPSKWNFVIFRQKLIKSLFVFSDEYFFFINFNQEFESINVNTTARLIVLKYLFTNIYFNTYEFFLKKIFHSFNLVFFRKIKFKGKGYNIFKSFRNSLFFRLNYAHKVAILSSNISLKFVAKTTIFLFGINFKDIVFISYKIKKLRPLNLFTWKGIRFSKQIVYKKTGKVSN